MIYHQISSGEMQFIAIEMNNFDARDSADYFGIPEEAAAGEWIVL